MLLFLHNRSGLLESEGDISTGLFMCYFIKLKEFITKPHRKANSPYFKVFTTETEIKVKRRDTAELNVNNSPGGLLPIMAYTGRLRPKGVPFSGFRYIKG